MTLLATETFTAADGTLIDARPCDTGQTWTKTADSDVANLVITGNCAHLSTLSTTAFTRYTLGVSLGSADYTLTATRKRASAGNASVDGLFLRSAGSTYYEFRRNGGTFEWFIGRVIGGGAETTLVTTSGIPSPGTNDLIVIASAAAGAAGSVDLSMTINIPALAVSQTVTFNDADATRILVTGLPGIGLYEPGVLEDTWDDIQVDGTAGGVTSAPTFFHRSSIRRR